MDWIAEAEAFIERQGPRRAAWTRERLFGETRNIWTLLANLDESSQVLVLGTQWGTSVAGVARLVASTTAVPFDEDSAAILAARFSGADSASVKLLEPGVRLPLPFGNSTFDAVVIAPPLDDLYQVLGADRSDAEELFAEISRVLVPEGAVHFTIHRIGIDTSTAKAIRAAVYLQRLGSNSRVFSRVPRLYASGFQTIHFYGSNSEY